MEYKQFWVMLVTATICLPHISCGEDLSAGRQKTERGNASAQNHLGDVYLAGQDVPRDVEGAAKRLRLAAEYGLADAQSLLGACYSKGEGVPQDYKEAAKWYRLAAEQGRAEAQYNLGLSYARGEGVPQDYANAYAWINLAAAQEHAAATQARTVILGKMTLAQIAEGQRLFLRYTDTPPKPGGNVPTEEGIDDWTITPSPNNQSNDDDLITACPAPPLMSPGQNELSAWRQKAERGDAAAQYKLGRAYYEGQGVPQDCKKAANWFRLAAEQGDVAAQTEMGLSFYHGKGARQNYKEAVKWFRLAAERGNSAAQVYLGDCYYFAKGVGYDSEEANKWYCLAVAQWNESNCLGRAADVKTRLWKYWSKSGADAAEFAVSSWLLPAAKQGFAEAQVYLGDCYASGNGIKRERPEVPAAPNPHEAVKWYRLAAEQGSAEAQTKLGNYYSGDRGILADVNEAVKWYRLAAEHGDAEAQYRLGLCYKFGAGVPKNFIKAVWWQCKAETQTLLKWEGGRDKALLTLFAGSSAFIALFFMRIRWSIEIQKNLAKDWPVLCATGIWALSLLYCLLFDTEVSMGAAFFPPIALAVNYIWWRLSNKREE